MTATNKKFTHQFKIKRSALINLLQVYEKEIPLFLEDNPFKKLNLGINKYISNHFLLYLKESKPGNMKLLYKAQVIKRARAVIKITLRDIFVKIRKKDNNLSQYSWENALNKHLRKDEFIYDIIKESVIYLKPINTIKELW